MLFHPKLHMYDTHTHMYTHIYAFMYVFIGVFFAFENVIQNIDSHSFFFFNFFALSILILHLWTCNTFFWMHRYMMILWMHQLMAQPNGWGFYTLARNLTCSFFAASLTNAFCIFMTIASPSFRGAAGRTCGHSCKFFTHLWMELFHKINELN